MGGPVVVSPFKARDRRRLESMWHRDPVTALGREGAENYAAVRSTLNLADAGHLSPGFATRIDRFEWPPPSQLACGLAWQDLEGHGTTSAFKASERGELYPVASAETPRLVAPRRFVEAAAQKEPSMVVELEGHVPPTAFALHREIVLSTSYTRKLPDVAPGRYNVDRLFEDPDFKVRSSRPTSTFASRDSRELYGTWATLQLRGWSNSGGNFGQQPEPTHVAPEPYVKGRYRPSAAFMPGPQRVPDDLEELKRLYKRELSTPNFSLTREAPASPPPGVHLDPLTAPPPPAAAAAAASSSRPATAQGNPEGGAPGSGADEGPVTFDSSFGSPRGGAWARFSIFDVDDDEPNPFFISPVATFRKMTLPGKKCFLDDDGGGSSGGGGDNGGFSPTSPGDKKRLGGTGGEIRAY